MTVNTEYVVSGMSCQHCVDAVTGELARLDLVEEVGVDLEAGTVTVTVSSGEPLDREVVRAAIDETGYELVDSVD
jgi:copper chaperone CopZ